MTINYDPLTKVAELIADCPEGATSAKAYKNGVYSGAAYIVKDKITKKISNIMQGEAYTLGLSALYGETESEVTEEILDTTK